MTNIVLPPKATKDSKRIIMWLELHRKTPDAKYLSECGAVRDTDGELIMPLIFGKKSIHKKVARQLSKLGYVTVR